MELKLNEEGIKNKSLSEVFGISTEKTDLLCKQIYLISLKTNVIHEKFLILFSYCENDNERIFVSYILGRYEEDAYQNYKKIKNV